MAGKIKRMVDTLITKRANGDEVVRNTTTIKLVLKGIDPARYTASSPDDPAIIGAIERVAQDLKIQL